MSVLQIFTSNLKEQNVAATCGPCIILYSGCIYGPISWKSALAFVGVQKCQKDVQTSPDMSRVSVLSVLGAATDTAMLGGECGVAPVEGSNRFEASKIEKAIGQAY